jgi:hypothetical protein
MKNKNLFIAGAVIALLIAAFILGKCSTKQERDNAVNNLIAAKDTIHASIVTINGLTNYVSEQKAIILTQKEALVTSYLEKEALKKLHLKDVVTNTQLEGAIKIARDSLKLVPGTTIITIKDTSGLHDYVKIPFTLLDMEEPDLHLIAGMNINKNAYFSLSTPFTGSMTVAYKKTGLFKTTPYGIFTTTNQYIKINSMDVVIIQQPKAWYTKWYVHALFGAGAALTVQHYLK